MSGYGYQTYQQKMLEEERDEVKREFKKQLIEQEAKITEIKQQLRLNREVSHKLVEEATRLARECVRIKKLISPVE